MSYLSPYRWEAYIHLHVMKKNEKGMILSQGFCQSAKSAACIKFPTWHRCDGEFKGCRISGLMLERTA